MRPLLAAPLLLVATASAQTVLLRYRPPVGKTFAYTMTTSMTMASPQKTPGMKGPMSFRQSAPMTIRVVSQTPDATTIEMKTGPTKTAAGSALGNAPQTSAPQIVRMTLDRFGTLKAGSGAGPATAIMSSMGGNMQGVVFPAKPVRVGDTWTQTIDLGKIMSGAKAGSMRVQGKLPMVYRLTALKGGIATIEMASKGAMTMAMGAQAIKTSMNMRATSSIDSSTGLTKSTALVSDSATQLPGMGAMRQHMTMSMK